MSNISNTRSIEASFYYICNFSECNYRVDFPTANLRRTCRIFPPTQSMEDFIAILVENSLLTG